MEIEEAGPENEDERMHSLRSARPAERGENAAQTAAEKPGERRAPSVSRTDQPLSTLGKGGAGAFERCLASTCEPAVLWPWDGALPRTEPKRFCRHGAAAALVANEEQARAAVRAAAASALLTSPAVKAFLLHHCDPAPCLCALQLRGSPRRVAASRERLRREARCFDFGAYPASQAYVRAVVGRLSDAGPAAFARQRRLYQPWACIDEGGVFGFLVAEGCRWLSRRRTEVHATTRGAGAHGPDLLLREQDSALLLSFARERQEKRARVKKPGKGEGRRCTQAPARPSGNEEEHPRESDTADRPLPFDMQKTRGQEDEEPVPVFRVLSTPEARKFLRRFTEDRRRRGKSTTVCSGCPPCLLRPARIYEALCWDTPLQDFGAELRRASQIAAGLEGPASPASRSSPAPESANTRAFSGPQRHSRTRHSHSGYVSGEHAGGEFCRRGCELLARAQRKHGASTAKERACFASGGTGTETRGQMAASERTRSRARETGKQENWRRK